MCVAQPLRDYMKMMYICIHSRCGCVCVSFDMRQTGIDVSNHKLGRTDGDASSLLSAFEAVMLNT